MPSYVPPRAIQRLPLQLLRSQDTLREREETAIAVEAYLEGQLPPAHVFSSRSAQTRWKTPPTPTAWGESALSALTALEQEHYLLEQIRAANVRPPTMSPVQAAESLGAREMPMPYPAPEIYDEPIARGVVSAARQVTAPELSAQLLADEIAAGQRIVDSAARRMHALAEAQGALDNVDAILGR